MFGELANGVKMAFIGVKYPQLIGFVEDVVNFGLWLQENFKIEKEEFEELKEYISKKFEELEKKEEELSDEELQKAFGDIVLKAMKKAGKYIKASKYDEGLFKVVLLDKEGKKLILAIKAKVVE